MFATFHCIAKRASTIRRIYPAGTASLGRPVCPTLTGRGSFRRPLSGPFDGLTGSEIQVLPNGQLGASRDIIESASSGAPQMLVEGAAQYAQFVAPFSTLEAPYVWRDPAHIRRALAAR
jgi:Bacterial extracellular solute-binding protein, family 7